MRAVICDYCLTPMGVKSQFLKKVDLVIQVRGYLVGDRIEREFCSRQCLLDFLKEYTEQGNTDAVKMLPKTMLHGVRNRNND